MSSSKQSSPGAGPGKDGSARGRCAVSNGGQVEIPARKYSDRQGCWLKTPVFEQGLRKRAEVRSSEPKRNERAFSMEMYKPQGG
jgi:hypothetical protein